MQDKNARDFIILLFDGYCKRKEENRLYDRDSSIPELIISTYYNLTENPNFDSIYSNFKRNYLYNESRVDGLLTPEELQGLGLVYDYIRKFDVSSQNINIFCESLKIHQKLFSKCVDPSFGGSLRENTAILLGSTVEVPDAREAKEYFQSYLTKTLPQVDPNNKDSIFDCINASIYATTELIKAQPFADGNKRTFRSLLNLLFKQYDLPPVYVKTKERKEYKDGLYDAFTKKDYRSLNQFYYYKICDSIYELDILPELHPERSPKPKQKVK